MCLLVAGGQHHGQWKHFSYLDPVREYRIYVDKSNKKKDPYGQGPKAGPERTISATIDGRVTRGYVQLPKTKRKMGAFSVNREGLDRKAVDLSNLAAKASKFLAFLLQFCLSIS